MQNIHPIIDKIVNANSGTYIIFFVYQCRYSMEALNLLRNSKVRYKGYDINDINGINGNIGKLLEILNRYSDIINFDRQHKTKPIIFLDGKFIGGYNELAKRISVV